MAQVIMTGSEEFSGRNFINNVFVEPKSGKVYERTYPVDGSKIGVFADSSPQDAEMAIEAAAEAFKSWSRTTYEFRADLLAKLSDSVAKHSDEISQILTTEIGKILTESIFEVKLGTDALKWFAYETKRVHGQFINVKGKKKMIVNHKPHGVVVIINAYHSPFSLIIAALGALLGAGCTAVIKPSTEVPLDAIKLAMLCKEVGFPPGVVNVVTADFLSTPSIGTVLCSHPLVRHVSFFGSTDVGRDVMKNLASTAKRCNMHLSGNSPAIVFKSANIPKCADKLITSKIFTNGQCCIAPNRIFVQSEIYDEFIRILIEKVTPLKAGNPMDKSSSYSGLTDQRRYDHVAQIVDLTIKQGAKLTYQAEKVPECGPYHFPLTILTECKTSMDICQYEIFGPVFAIYKYIHESVRFEQEAEVFEAMNQGIYGLASYVYSAEIDQVLRTVDELEYALVSVNDIHPFEMLVPFGGLKESGSGNLLGLRSIYGFLDESSVIINHE